MEQISQSVQILYNLNMLVTSVSDFVNSSLNSLKQLITDNLNTLLDSAKPKSGSSTELSKRGPGKAAMPSMGNTLSFRPRLWSALDEIFDVIYSYAIEIEILEASLYQSKNDFTNIKSQNFIEIFPENKREITQNFWLSINSYLGDQLIKSSKSCKFIREALEGEYPRFLRLYIDLCKKLQTYEKPENFSYNFVICKNVIATFEQAYLSNLDSVVSFPVHNMFSLDVVPKLVPSTEDIDTLIRIIRRLAFFCNFFSDYFT